MKITNKLDLPEPFVLYTSKSDYGYTPLRYSVTELLLPVREILLNRMYADAIERDVADNIPALFGTAVHNVLENNTPILSHLRPEVSVDCEFGDNVVSGRIDLLDLKDLEIIDYKTCSVSKIMREDFEDWQLQGMMYAYLVFKKFDIITKNIKFYGLMKDWSKLKAANSANYPQSPVYVYKYKLEDSDYDFIEKWIKVKLEAIELALESNILPECTDTEKWYTGTTYAVYKNVGDKRASYTTDNEDDAHNYITNKCGGAGEIHIRKGEYLKCKYYCDCCKFCEKERNNGQVIS